MFPAPWGRDLGSRLMSVPLPFAFLAFVAAAALALAACGSEERQDENEPEGEFEVEVLEAKFPTRQRLAETSDLIIEVENTGEETVPQLAYTIFTDEGLADGSFSIRSDQPGLANPNRPVWVLENKYPRLAGMPRPTGLSGGLRAQTNTFSFGPLDPGESQTAIWRVTPVQSGTYTLSYIISGGLSGKAKAVTASGDEAQGEFVVTITDKPPRTRVNDKGRIVSEKK